jgi:hypothetical protein
VVELVEQTLQQTLEALVAELVVYVNLILFQYAETRLLEQLLLVVEVLLPLIQEVV